MIQHIIRSSLIVCCTIVSLLFLSQLFGPPAEAEKLTYVSDLIRDSDLSEYTDHRIQFTTVNPIPPGGSIFFNFEGGLHVPTQFYVNDMDLSVATTATSSDASYVDRLLATSSSATHDGVTIVSGTSTAASFVITLNSSEGIGAGETVRIELGTNATYQGTGQNQLRNAPDPGPILLNFLTRNAALVQIDFAIAAITMIQSVTAGPAQYVDVDPPLIFDINPALDELVTGVVDQIQFSFRTDTVAECRYDTVASTTFDSMSYSMITNNATSTPYHQSQIISVSTSSTHTFYVICDDFNGNETEETLIRFDVGVVPIGPGPDGTTGDNTFASSTDEGSGSGSGTGSGSGSGGGGGGGGGGAGAGGQGNSGNSSSGGEFLQQADVTITGFAYPGAEVVILQDGVEVDTMSPAGDGSFERTITGIERGTYTFSVYANDRNGVRSNTYSTTIALRAGTVNQISNVVVPPTLIVADNEVDPGTPLLASGYSTPDGVVFVALGKQGSRVEVVASGASTTAASNGVWTLEVASTGLGIDTYVLQAVTRLEERGIESNESTPVLVGLGEVPEGDQCPRADINRDTSVNLTDFSIMLFNWNTNEPNADINLSGLVELTDFSIMLFCWTG